MNYKSLIINRLLDKYEKSKSLVEQSNRRVILKMNDFEQYDIENYETKKILHDVIFDLKNKNIIDYSWKEHEIRKYTK